MESWYIPANKTGGTRPPGKPPPTAHSRFQWFDLKIGRLLPPVKGVLYLQRHAQDIDRLQLTALVALVAHQRMQPTALQSPQLIRGPLGRRAKPSRSTCCTP
jgi:hypothetical protein